MITLRKLIERLAARASVADLVRLRRLREETDADTLEVPEPEAGDDPADAVGDAFKQAAYAVIDDLMEHSDDAAVVKAGLAKLKKLLASHGDVNGDGKVDEEDVAAATTESWRWAGDRISEARTADRWRWD